MSRSNRKWLHAGGCLQHRYLYTHIRCAMWGSILLVHCSHCGTLMYWVVVPIWNTKQQVATTDKQRKVKLCLGTVASPHTRKPLWVISLKKPMTCCAWSEEEASMLGFWILQFPSFLHVCPVFFLGSRFPPPTLCLHMQNSSLVPSRQCNEQKPNSSGARIRPTHAVLEAKPPPSAPVFASISMPGTCKTSRGLGPWWLTGLLSYISLFMFTYFWHFPNIIIQVQHTPLHWYCVSAHLPWARRRSWT